VTELVFELLALKAKIRDVLTGLLVAMVAYYPIKMTRKAFVNLGAFA